MKIKNKNYFFRWMHVLLCSTSTNRIFSCLIFCIYRWLLSRNSFYGCVWSALYTPLKGQISKSVDKKYFMNLVASHPLISKRFFSTERKGKGKEMLHINTLFEKNSLDL
jgi:hypothetical protein